MTLRIGILTGVRAVVFWGMAPYILVESNVSEEPDALKVEAAGFYVSARLHGVTYRKTVPFTCRSVLTTVVSNKCRVGWGASDTIFRAGQEQ
jgi:hypothetical protein